MNLSAMHKAIRATVAKRETDRDELSELSTVENAALGSWQHRLYAVGGEASALLPALPTEEWMAPPPMESNLT
jgi:hypothetical protein